MLCSVLLLDVLTVRSYAQPRPQTCRKITRRMVAETQAFFLESSCVIPQTRLLLRHTRTHVAPTATVSGVLPSSPTTGSQVSCTCTCSLLWCSCSALDACLLCRYAQQLPSLTQQALGTTGAVQLQDLTTSTNALGSCTVPFVAHELSPTASKVPPVWLTPQQLQSRQLGGHVSFCSSFMHCPYHLVPYEVAYGDLAGSIVFHLGLKSLDENCVRLVKFLSGSFCCLQA